MLNRDISGGLRGGCIEGGKGGMEKDKEMRAEGTYMTWRNIFILQ